MGNAESIIISKMFSAIGGLTGGSILLAFIKPKTITEAFFRGGISVGASVILSIQTLLWMGIAPEWYNQIISGLFIGFIAYSVLGIIINLLTKIKIR